MHCVSNKIKEEAFLNLKPTDINGILHTPATNNTRKLRAHFATVRKGMDLSEEAYLCVNMDHSERRGC